MIREHDVEGLLDRWLGEGPEEVPDVVVEQALATIDSTNQVRAPFGRSWRGITMPKFAPVAIGTAAVLLIAVLGVGLFGGANNTRPVNPAAPPSPSGSAPAAAASPSSASPSAVASVAPSPAAAPIDTADWIAYRSDRYGFDLSYPKGYTARPSDRDWTMDPDRVNDLTSAAEGFLAPDYSTYVSAFAAKIPAGTSPEAWQAEYQQPIDGCEIKRTEPATVDGHQAIISHTCQESHAFVFIGDRAYVFAVWKPNQEALLRAFLSTVQFRPGNGLTTGASPSGSAVACEDGLAGCAGPLQPGEHRSAHFAPKLIHTTPAGWTNSIDSASIYKLDPADSATPSILIWSDVDIAEQTADCAPVGKRGGASVQDWIAFLTTHPGLVATEPTPADLPGGGESNAVSIDVAVARDWTATCPASTEPEVVLISHRGDPTAAYGVRASQRLRLIILDVRDTVVVTEVYGPSSPEAFATAVAGAQGVINTFKFGCGPSVPRPCGVP